MQNQKRDFEQKGQLPIEFMSPFPVEACLARLHAKERQAPSTSLSMGGQWAYSVSPHADGIWRYQITRGKANKLDHASIDGYLIRSTDGKSTLILGDIREDGVPQIVLLVGFFFGLFFAFTSASPSGLAKLLFFLGCLVMGLLASRFLAWNQRSGMVTMVERLFGSWTD